MTYVKNILALTAAACAALMLAHGASAATEERLSGPEAVKLTKCMAMTSDVLAKDAQCTAVIKKASLTPSDIEKMRRCESVQEDVMKNPDCAAMIKKHPELVRGHGSLTTEEPSRPNVN